MQTIAPVAVDDELLDLLTAGADVKRLLGFRLSAAKQGRLDELLEKNREGCLSDDEQSVLNGFEHFEHVVRLLKARLHQKAGAEAGE